MVAETKVKGRSQSSRKEKVGEERKWGEKKRAGWGEKAGRKRGGKKGGKTIILNMPSKQHQDSIQKLLKTSEISLLNQA